MYPTSLPCMLSLFLPNRICVQLSSRCGNDLRVLSSEAQSRLLQGPWCMKYLLLLFLNPVITDASRSSRIYRALLHCGDCIFCLPRGIACPNGCIFFIYATQHIYSQLSAQLRVLKAQDVNILQSHLAETVTGIEHIRSFTQQPQSVGKMTSMLYASRKLSYYDFKADGNLAACCDTLCGLIAVIVVASASLWPENTWRSGFALSLLSISTFSDVLRGAIRISVNLQDYLGTVRRVRKFCQGTPPEQSPSSTPSLPDPWPPTGQLDFRQTTCEPE